MLSDVPCSSVDDSGWDVPSVACVVIPVICGETLVDCASLVIVSV